MIPKLIAKLKQSQFRRRFNRQYNQWLSDKNTTFSPVPKNKPLISIVTPVYNPSPNHIVQCIESVLRQTYDNWELCLADDHSTNPQIISILKRFQMADQRIKVVFRQTNGHISVASNSALTLATGDYIALLDHDDTLPPHALSEVVNFINHHPQADFIYTDEDKIEPNGQYSDPSFKPDFSPDYFHSTNYLCHLAIIRKKVIDQLHGFRPGYEGSQDYDLFLQISKITNNIYHLPQVLYHWRKVSGSTAAIYSDKSYANIASIKALSDYFGPKIKISNGLQPGTFKISYPIIHSPKVSIIIPTKDKVALLKTCIESITSSTYKNYEIIIVNNQSQDPPTKQYFQQIKLNPKIKVTDYSQTFNFSAINNFATTQADGQFLLFLNNDTEVITPDWIESLLEHAQRPEIGAVGCKLLYPNHDIQHAGVILGLGGIANHAAYKLSDLVSQPFPLLNSKDVVRNYLAVTGACFMIEKNKFTKIGGFNPKLKIAYNDIDLCLRLFEDGYLNLYTPHAKLYHFESSTISISRDLKLFKQEQDYFYKKWSRYIESDPYFTPHLDKNQPYLYSCVLS